MVEFGVVDRPLRITLVGASIRREEELPGFAETRDFASESYNLAIGSLKAAVSAERDLAEATEIELHDLEITWDRKQLGARAIEGVIASSPAVLGVSCYCWSIDTLLDLVVRAKRELPALFVVLGGPSAAPQAEDLLKKHEQVDAVATGEGEATFIDLLRALVRGRGLEGVAGLTVRGKDGEPIANAASRDCMDLAFLPSPYTTGALEVVGKSLLLETSRGCRFRCRFCSWMGGAGRLRYRPIEAVEADLSWAMDRGIESIKIADTAINFDDERVAELVGAVQRVDPRGEQLALTYFLKQELLTERQAALLARVPAEEIIVGIESLEPVPRRAVGKSAFDPSELERKLSLLEPVGPVTLSVILGLPGDTREGLLRTLEWLVDLDAGHPGCVHVICLFWLAVLPGSRFHRDRDRMGFRLLEGETPYLLESAEHSPEDLLEMARDAAELHFAHPTVRLEYFHKEYLAQDAPRERRHTRVPRRHRDPRKRAVLLGWQPTKARVGGGYDAELEIAGLGAYAQSAPDLLREWNLELSLPGHSFELRESLLSSLAEVPPELVVICCESSAAPGLKELLAEIRRQWEGARLLLVVRSNPADCELADAVVVGEAEQAVRQVFESGLPASRVVVGEPLGDLDEIPSPYQWGMVQMPGRSVTMELTRPALPGATKPRAHGPRRVFGDLRWALEQRYRHIRWIDRPFPTDPTVLSAFVEAVRRADPGGLIEHGLETVSPEALEILAELPLSNAEDDEAARVAALLRPWTKRGYLGGWRFEGVVQRRSTPAVMARFSDEEGREVPLVIEPEGGGYRVAPAASANRGAREAADLTRLVKLVQGVLDKGIRAFSRDPRSAG